MDKFLETAEEKTKLLSRRETISAVTGISFGAFFGKLFSFDTAYAQDGAAVVAAIKAEAVAWTAVYKQYADIANGILDKTRAAVEGVHTLQNARKIITDQEAANRNLVNQFWAFGKDPLGASLPMIHVESQPIFKAMDKLAGYYDTLVESKSTNEADKKAITARSRLETQRALATNDAIATRKNINALSKTVGKAKHSEKSYGQLFAENAMPILVEQNQAMLECMLRMEKMVADLYGASLGKLPPEKERFTAADREKLKKSHKDGLGTLIPPSPGS